MVTRVRHHEREPDAPGRQHGPKRLALGVPLPDDLLPAIDPHLDLRQHGVKPIVEQHVT